YPNATRDFKELAKNYPDSEQLPRYEFMVDFSDRLSQVLYASGSSRAEAFVGLRTFCQNHKDEPLLKEKCHHVWDAFLNLARDFKQAAQEHHDRAALTQAREALAECPPFKPDDLPANDTSLVSLTQDLATIDGEIVKWEKLQKILERFRALVLKPVAEEFE